MLKAHKILPFFVIAILLSFPHASHCAELSALELKEYCAETEKGFLGQKFDAEKSQVCRGYMMGFFDSMIISEQLTRKPPFCIPKALPKIQNTAILNDWVKNNSSISETTTAAVALYAAYAKTFPCK